MLVYKEGTIFKTEAQAIICPVNVVGVMGAGLAKQIAVKWPEVEYVYKLYVQGNLMKLGRLKLVPSSDARPAIILFPTKNHWKDPSKLEWIEEGLNDLARHVDGYGYKSIAMPMIGCGLGGLKWSDVKPLIEKILKKSHTEIEIYIAPDLQKKRLKKRTR